MAKRRPLGWVCLGIGLVGLGCGKIPFFHKAVSIDFTAPPAVLYNREPLDLQPTALDKEGKALVEAAFAYDVAPPHVAVVGTDGALRCLVSGEAQLTVTHEGLHKEAAFACRMIGAVEIAPMQEIDVNQPVPLSITVKDEQGNRVEGAPVEVTTLKPEVVAVEGTTITGVQVGRAMVLARLEGREGSVQVDVGQTVVTETLDLPDGAARQWPLTGGTYRVKVETQGLNGRPAGVEVGWGGTTCKGSAETTRYAVDCYVPSSGMLTLTNPTVIGEGIGLTGSLSIRQIPAEALGG